MENFVFLLLGIKSNDLSFGKKFFLNFLSRIWLVSISSWQKLGSLLHFIWSFRKMSHNYSFVVLKYLFWNELTFLFTYDVIITFYQKQPFADFLQKMCFYIFCSIHRKTSVLESLLACKFIKKRLQHRCFLANIAKFLRTAFLKNFSERLLL